MFKIYCMVFYNVGCPVTGRAQNTLATLGADYHSLQHQTRCLENLKNFTEIRLSNIIDADMAQASIEYKASQVRK